MGRNSVELRQGSDIDISGLRIFQDRKLWYLDMEAKEQTGRIDDLPACSRSGDTSSVLDIFQRIEVFTVM